MTKVFLILSLFIITSCNNHTGKDSKNKFENSYTIKGNIDGRDTGWVFLCRKDTTGLTSLIILDSARVSKSHFYFNGKLARPLIGKIMIKSIKGYYSYTSYFALDNGITVAHLYNDSMANSVITGTPMQESLNTFNKKLYDLEISFDYNFALNRKGIISNDSLNKLQAAFYRDKNDLILKQIKSNPSSITSAFVARLVLPDQPELSTLDAICSALGNANNYYARQLFEVLAAKKQSRPGMQAPSFSFTDIKNRTFTNHSFKGQYLFFDFWASWCAPCREENPGLVKLYDTFKNKGVEFVSISIDMDKKNWETAIKKDKLTWLQACDLEGSQSKIFNEFGLTDIPTNFLIDKEGKIVARDVSVGKLKKILSEKSGD
ncbi:MAG: TlpA disulfide reductase family protein [Ginsengibacter sp.]